MQTIKLKSNNHKNAEIVENSHLKKMKLLCMC